MRVGVSRTWTKRIGEPCSAQEHFDSINALRDASQDVEYRKRKWLGEEFKKYFPKWLYDIYKEEGSDWACDLGKRICNIVVRERKADSYPSYHGDEIFIYKSGNIIAYEQF